MIGFMLSAILHPRIFLLGVTEGRRFASVGLTFGDPTTRRSEAYDVGLNVGEWIGENF